MTAVAHPPQQRLFRLWPVRLVFAMFGRRRAFVSGLLCGVIIVFGGRFAVNRTSFADRLVSPLLLSDTAGAADAIVVMGAGVVGDCTPNLNGIRRVMVATRLWRAKRAPLVLFTGGMAQGACPIAVAMSQFAQEVGLSEAVIRLETTSTNTHENARDAAPILRAAGAARIVVVTDRLHMRRSEGTLRRLGFHVERASVPVYEGHLNNVDMLASGLREYVALVYYRLRGWIDGSRGAPSAAALGETTSRMVDAQRSSVQTESRNPGGPLVIHGASYAAGWNLQRIGQMRVVNRGVAGQQSFELHARFEKDVVSARPRAVLIWGFINDIFRAPADPTASLERIRESYRAMIELARRQGIEPIVATEVTTRPRDSWSESFSSFIGGLLGKEGYHDYINRHVLETNRWMVDMAKRERILVLDFQMALGERGGRRRREFTDDDGSHITSVGYDALTAYARPVLMQHFASPEAAR